MTYGPSALGLAGSGSLGIFRSLLLGRTHWDSQLPCTGEEAPYAFLMLEGGRATMPPAPRAAAEGPRHSLCSPSQSALDSTASMRAQDFVPSWEWGG